MNVIVSTSFGRSPAAETMKAFVRERYSRLPREDEGFTATHFEMAEDLATLRGVGKLARILGN